MVVEIVQDKEIWDRFIDESPYGLIFHKWEFLKIVEKYSGYTLYPCGVFRGDILIGVFPLYYKRNMAFKAIFSPPPQSGIPYLGFVMSSEYNGLKQDKKEVFLNQVVDEINDYIELASPNYVSISTVSNFIDIRPFKWNNFEVVPNYNYVIHLDEDLDSIWNGFKKNLRKQLSRPEILDLRLVPSEDMSLFYNLAKQRYEEQGLTYPIYSIEYLEDLFRVYPNHLRLYYLYYGDDLLGSITTQEYKRYILWMGNTRIPDNIFGNEYIIWHLIQKAKEEGYLNFEITGANKKNLCQFKTKFNPTLEICYNVCRKDTLGKLAETTYQKFVRKAG
ncbi:GNAT family N-acetyltransferase [Methanoculleus sp. 7T]|uniref:GNAT family N-acetyltransferase n=1 Tax=Methanoculleus sp. 7T TaxID=2937282 RepID=UPI0020C0CA7D|nr:GNAT family N-acetyltransferase [Methanoculleus sp. 7T]MCK8517540.1 GNAT family N-acetyltransferase [Methanoculleus sp. 7T]